MSTNDSNDWVKEGTPREEWDADNDYGVEIEPAEWDDYSEEQAVQVPTPAAAKEYQPPAAREDDAAPLGEPDAPDVPEAMADVDPEYDVAPADAEHEPQFDAATEPEPEPELAVDAPEDPATQPEPEATVEDEPLPEDAVAEPEPEAADDPDATRVHPMVADEPVSPVEAGEAPEAPETATPEPDVDPDATMEHAAVADPAPAVDPAAAGAPAALGGLYRDEPAAEPATDETQVIDQSRLEREQALEEERLAKLQEQRDARDARLGIVPGSDAGSVRVVTKPSKRQSDRFFGAFSIFVLRLVTAAVIGILGFQVLQDIDASEAFFATTVIPEPRLTAWILGSVLIASAFLLVIGLGVRIVGFLLLAISIASLATIRWGAFSIFVENMEGFLGDRTLLTAAVALILLAFGGGGWSIDGAIRGAREESKAARTD